MKDACSWLAMAVVLAVSAASAGISPELACALDRADATGESLPVVLTLQSPIEISSLARGIGLEHISPEARVPALIACLQEYFRLTLSERMSRLSSLPAVTDLRGYWAGSMIAFRAPSEVIRELAEDPAVELELDSELGLPHTTPRQAPPSLPSHAEPGLAVIHAHKLWELGYTGEGVTIMSLDTGVDLDHPALRRSWRGNRVPPSAAWFDPVYGTETPSDYGIDPPGHGTMTTGVMVGLDPATRDTIGVAFGAEWIAAGDSIISISMQVACLQWALDPDGDPGTIDDMPAVVNCSWTRGNRGCKETGLTMAISALEAAGVAVVFSAGNDGPAPGSVNWPARMNSTETDVFAVGFINGHDPGLPIGVPSGRGPTECTGLGNAIKPEVVAPGESVRTTWVDSQYATVSGTSLSAPHVSGAIALLKQAFPRKTGTELKMLLLESARDLGEEGEDNTYGAGCIDIYAAYLCGLATDVAELPVHRWVLDQNYPNPFNPLTHIRYDVPRRSQVRITVYSLLGVEVARLVDREIPPGSYSAVFDATGLPSGLYVCRMLADGFQQARKLLLIR
jgi:subtilisin family serine protease